MKRSDPDRESDLGAPREGERPRAGQRRRTGQRRRVEQRRRAGSQALAWALIVLRRSPLPLTGLLGPGALAAATTTRRIAVGDWERLEVGIPADVYVSIGSTSGASIRAEPRIIDRIRLAVGDRTLRITASDNLTTTESMEITLQTRALSSVVARATCNVVVGAVSGPALRIVAAESADVALDELAVDSLQASVSGSATLRIAGQVRVQQLDLADSATFDGARLRCGAARIAAGGSSDADVDCRESLEVDLRDAATVRYAGRPRLRQKLADGATLEARR